MVHKSSKRSQEEGVMVKRDLSQEVARHLGHSYSFPGEFRVGSKGKESKGLL